MQLSLQAKSISIFLLICATTLYGSPLIASDLIYRYHSLSHGSADISIVRSGNEVELINVGLNDVDFTGSYCADTRRFLCLLSVPFSFAVPRDLDASLSSGQSNGEYFWAYENVRYVVREALFSKKLSYKLRMQLLGREFDAYQIFAYRLAENDHSEQRIGTFIWSPENGLIAFSTYHGQVAYDSGVNTSFFTDYWLVDYCGFGAKSSCVQ